MFSQTGAGFLPRQFQTDQKYTTTFSGPIKPNENNAISARNESMAKAAFGGDQRQFQGQMGKGIAAGSKMSAFRAGLLADAEAGKGYAQAQQDQLTAVIALAKAGELRLDLGKVNVMATATLNGKEFETLWMPPFELDVTKALKPGENRLRLQVVSTSPTTPSFGPEVRLKPFLESILK
jgi:hypothetical protein